MIDIEKLRERYQGPLLNQDIMGCIEEIERSRKEKEWLINIYATQLHNFAPFLSENKIENLKKDIVRRMQQALKEINKDDNI